jgi:quercetin dioxygenase-like cupin family protein
MTALDRRMMLAAGLGGAAAMLLVVSRASAEHYPADAGQLVEGSEGGVRRVKLSERPTMIPGFNKVTLIDIVFPPGSKDRLEEMPAAMVCHCTEGQLTITNDGETFTVKANDVWTCRKGGAEEAVNNGSSQAVMRVAILAA